MTKNEVEIGGVSVKYPSTAPVDLLPIGARIVLEAPTIRRSAIGVAAIAVYVEVEDYGGDRRIDLMKVEMNWDFVSQEWVEFRKESILTIHGGPEIASYVDGIVKAAWVASKRALYPV